MLVCNDTEYPDKGSAGTFYACVFYCLTHLFAAQVGQEEHPTLLSLHILEPVMGTI